MSEICPQTHTPEIREQPELQEGAGNGFGDERPHERQHTPEERRAAYEGWLERRGVDPTSVPHLEMGERELTMFANSLPGLARMVYEIPRGDQEACRYVFVDVEPSDSSLPSKLELVSVGADFGTKLDVETTDEDSKQPDSGSDGPPTPESGPAYVVVDIGEAIVASRKDLQGFSTTLMQGITANPFSRGYEDIAVRAGEPAPGQKDAYVWMVAPFARSVELTLNDPDTYGSVCVVRGQMKEAGNGKPSMAQIVDPEVVLKIEGDDLAKLQEIYHTLYSVADFALTRVQIEARDQLFNDHVVKLISEAARRNKARKDHEASSRESRPPLRRRQLPYR